MVRSEFEIVVREYMNYSDRMTLQAISEAINSPKDQTQILSALTSRLYDLIVAKADKIDYSTIAKSKGDITKIQNYDQLVECVDLIRQIVIEYKQSTKSIDVVSTAMENVKANTANFKKAFAVGSPILIMLYNNIVMSIVGSVSFMIATCIEYIKSPTSNSFEIALDTVAYSKTMENLMFRSLEEFNKGCQSPDFNETVKVCLAKRIVKELAIAASEEEEEDEEELDKPFFTPDEVKNGKQVVIHDIKEKSLKEDAESMEIMGDIFGIARILMFVLRCFIPILRTVVYYFYSSRQNIYDYFTVQAQLLEMNAEKLQYNNNIDENRRKKVYDKQIKVAAKFRKIANKFAIADSVGTKKTEEMKKSEDKKYDADDLANDTVENGDDDIF